MSIPKSISRAVGRKLSYNQDKMNEWYKKFYNARKIMIKKLHIENKNCRYCGCETFLDVENGNPFLATCDHIVPISKGGRNNRSNLTLSCSRCNNLKSTMETDDFKSLVKNKKYWENVRNEKMISLLETFSKNIIDVDDNQRERNSRRAFIISIIMYDKEIKLKVNDLIQDIDNAIINETNNYHEEIKKIKEFYRGLV